MCTHSGDTQGSGDTQNSVPGRRRGARDPRTCHPRGAGSPSPGWALPPRSAGRETSLRSGLELGDPHPVPSCVPIVTTPLQHRAGGAWLAPYPPPSSVWGKSGWGAWAGGPGPWLAGRPRPRGAVKGRNAPLFRLHNWFQFGAEEGEGGDTPRCPLQPGGPETPQIPRQVLLCLEGRGI